MAATLYETATLIHGELFGPLDPETAELVYRQYAVLATALQVPDHLWPADRDAFVAYWQHMIDTLEVGDPARDIARDLLHPNAAPLAIRAGMPLERFLTAAWLPERIRHAYGLPWNGRRQRRYELLVKGSGPVYRRLPLLLREAPKNYYLRRMRKRVRRYHRPDGHGGAG